MMVTEEVSVVQDRVLPTLLVVSLKNEDEGVLSVSFENFYIQSSTEREEKFWEATEKYNEFSFGF